MGGAVRRPLAQPTTALRSLGLPSASPFQKRAGFRRSLKTALHAGRVRGPELEAAQAQSARFLQGPRHGESERPHG